MKYSEFMGRLGSGELPHIFLLAGEEHYYIEKAKRAILHRLGSGKEDFDDALQKFTGEIGLETLMGNIETAPFFAEKQGGQGRGGQGEGKAGRKAHISL